MTFSLEDFVRESNRIEGILRDPTPEEVRAHRDFAAPLRRITIDHLVTLVGVLQPDAVLRDRLGLNVRVGDHLPPLGGPEIRTALQDVLDRVWQPDEDAYTIHHAYETLHPFTDGNGRSGRALWLYMMREAPLGFLHHWYYQSLAHSGYRGKADTIAA